MAEKSDMAVRAREIEREQARDEVKKGIAVVVGFILMSAVLFAVSDGSFVAVVLVPCLLGLVMILRGTFTLMKK